MKKLLRVKWEVVMLLINLVAVAVAWFTYFYTKDYNTYYYYLYEFIVCQIYYYFGT